MTHCAMNPNEENICGGETHKSSKALTMAVMVIVVMVGFVSVNMVMNEKEACMKLQLKLIMEKKQEASDFANGYEHTIRNQRERAAWHDCVELFENTMDSLNAGLNKDVVKETVQTWLIAAKANMDICLDRFTDMNLTSNRNFTTLMLARAVNVSELVTISLSMYNRRILQVKDEESQEMNSYHEDGFPDEAQQMNSDGFPKWVSGKERRLLQTSSLASLANVVVAQDGSGNFRTINEAVNAAPQMSSTRYVIYIKTGIYRENVEVPMSVTNLMFVGDGKDKTVVTGNRNEEDGDEVLTSATVGVSGNGFVARDMTFENTAGPEKGPAVALRISGDMGVVYRCSIKGYQDTLFAHYQRQFYREVDIYGTIDFIFGSAAVVIQNSNIIVRRPLSFQYNVITAHARTCHCNHTGIIIQNCRVSADSDLQAVKDSIKTYLGRPWQEYSRTVFMQCTLDDFIDPAGWVEEGVYGFQNSVYFGEYMNSGHGAGTSKRVRWGGYHIIKSAMKARHFTVGHFINGNKWIPSTHIPFTSGLSE